MTWLPVVWNAFHKLLRLFPLASAAALFAAGVVFWGGFNWSLEFTNTESFCLSCHAMREYVYQEYRETGHYTNRTGVRATCPDCHVPRERVHKVVRKVQATNELFHWIRGSIDPREKFEAKRPDLAPRVWVSMRATDSRECRNCHGIGFMEHQAQTAQASAMHVLSAEWGKTCIDCHQGVAHTLPKGFDKGILMDQLHDQMEKDEIECQLCHEEMPKPPLGEEW